MITSGSEAVIEVGSNLFVSHKDVCDVRSREFERTLHIWRPDHPNYSCNAVQQGTATGLVVEYKDGESLSNASHSINQIANFLSGTDKVLIHCTVGQTRSPTFALIGLVARGQNVYNAVGRIYGSSWLTRHIGWNFCLTPAQEIFAWAENLETSR